MFALSDEADFQFRLERRIVLPVGVDIPREQQARRRFPGEHATPVTSAAIFTPFIPTSANAGFDYSGNGIHLANLVASQRPPSADLFGEDSPGYVLRRVQADRLAHAVDIAAPPLLIHHRFLSFAASRSAARLNAMRVSSQNPSSQLRRAPMPRISIP